MKRPSGFTPPPEGRRPARGSAANGADDATPDASEAGSPRRSASDAPRAQGRAGSSASASPSGNDRSGTDKKTRAAASAPSGSGTSSSGSRGKKPGASFAAGRSTSGSSSASEAGARTPQPRDADADARASSGFLPSVRQARRERKRVERAEVKRFTARSRRRRRTWLIAGGSVVGIGVLAAALAFSPILSVRTIEVDGAMRVSSDAVVQGLQPIVGSPFPLVDQSAIKAELVKYPLIESYSVESRPPDTLVVKLVERTPVGVIDTGEGFTVVDAAGVVIEASNTQPTGYPLIEVPDGVTSEGFQSAAGVLRAMPDELRQKVSSVTAKTHDDVTLKLRDTDATVLWGSADDGAFKTLALERLMAATDPATVAQYDVSSRKTVVVREQP
jgi:cell division protein FtsQ